MGMHRPACIIWANLTHLSLKAFTVCQGIKINITKPETNKTVEVPFNEEMVQSLKEFGPPSCNYMYRW